MQHQSAEIRLEINISLGGEEDSPGLQARDSFEGLLDSTLCACKLTSSIPCPLTTRTNPCHEPAQFEP